MKIREASYDNLVECADIKFKADGSKYSKNEMALNLKYLKKYYENKDSKIIVAGETEIFGYIIYTFDIWNNSVKVDFIYVRPDKQGIKIGSSLLDFVIKEATNKNYRIIFVETKKTENRAIEFYKKNGFIINCIIQERYKNDDALIMSKHL